MRGDLPPRKLDRLDVFMDQHEPQPSRHVWPNLPLTPACATMLAKQHRLLEDACLA